MYHWTQDTATSELKALIEETESLTKETRFSAIHMRWVARTLGFLEQVFGRRCRFYGTFAHLSWRESGEFLIDPEDYEENWSPQRAIDERHHAAYLKQLESAKGLLLAALDDLTRRGIDGVYEGKNTAPESSALVRIIGLIERKLRKAIRQKPEREKEIQDAFETLLVGADIGYSRETDSIVYSSKTYKPDFTFEPIDLALDLKLCNRGDREKEIIAEINDDILSYKTKYGNVFFVVYDLGFIRDVERFSETFEANDGVFLRVVKH